MHSINHLPPAVEKREKKKPSRGASLWGQCSVPHSDHSSRALDSSSTLATTNSNGVVKTNSNIVSATDTVEASLVSKVMSSKSMKNKGKIKPPPKMMRYVTQVSLSAIYFFIFLRLLFLTD
jgi:hypothetical protein